MLKEKVSPSEIAEQQMQAKWQNIYFGTDGRKGTSSKYYETQAAAQTGAQHCIKQLSAAKNERKKVDLYCQEGKLKDFSYSWHMQLPTIA